jgi:hypothetical protein
MPSQATRPPLVGMPAVWLRDNCPCPLCRDPVSGQRLLHITDIPAVLAVAASLGYVRETNYGRLFDVRHLQGCYADLDGVESAVAVGERATTGVIRRKDRI